MFLGSRTAYINVGFRPVLSNFSILLLQFSAAYDTNFQ